MTREQAIAFLCDLEGKGVQVGVGNMREIFKIYSRAMVTNPEFKQAVIADGLRQLRNEGKASTGAETHIED